MTVIRQDTIANIVLGNVSVEEGIEAYRQQAEALGIRQILAEMNR